MFCGTCGTRNPDINKFCRQCGSRLPERPQRTLSEDQFADLQSPTAVPVDHAKVAVLMDVAFAYHREGKADQAIQTCQEAIALNPESTSAHSLLAVLYEEKGQFDEAVAHQRRVLELNPDSAADQENLARLLGEHTPSSPAPAARRVPIPRANYPVLAGVGAAMLVLTVVMVPMMRAMRTADEPHDRSTRPMAANYGPQSPGTGGAAVVTPSTAAPSAAITPPPAPTPQAAPTPAAEPFEQGDEAMPSPVVPRRAYQPIRTEPLAPSDEEPLQPLPPPSGPHAAPVAIGGTPAVTPPAAPARAAAAPAPSAPSQPPSLEATFIPTSARPAGRATPPAPAEETPRPSRTVIRVSDPSARDYEQWARQASATGNYTQAVGHYQKALSGARGANERGRIHQQMGYAYQQMGKTSEAESEYRSAIHEYQQQESQGTNAELARAGIRASEAGLRSLGM